MAKIRTVKPELFRHEELYEIEKKVSIAVANCICRVIYLLRSRRPFSLAPKAVEIGCITL